MNTDVALKKEKLISILKGMGSVAVAFSGGVDSTFLLMAAHETLGEKAIAVTVRSRLFPERELYEAIAFTKEHGIKHVFCDANELEIKGFAENPENRCYLCKTALFTMIRDVAGQHGISYVAEGSNMDDLSDYRPGLKAIEELKVKSPLREAGLFKEEIRLLSKEMGLSTWHKRSFACLASRFVYGEKITKEKLLMVDKAEQLLLTLGFTQFRVRIHGNLARIELPPEEIGKMTDPNLRSTVHARLKEYGFSYVSLDLKGYRMGSMNETLA